MAEDAPPIDEMQYEKLAQDALRGVVRSALERAASPSGIPGAHHFYMTFKTRGAWCVAYRRTSSPNIPTR